MLKIVLAVVLIAAALYGYLFHLRRDFPYQLEVVPADHQLWVINTTSWADKDCTVTLNSPAGDKSRFLLPGSSRTLQIDGLENDKPYSLTIRRHDLPGRLLYRATTIQRAPRAGIRQYIVLVGASVGRGWDLNQFAARTMFGDLFYGYRSLKRFDKSPAITELTTALKRPDAVIIKECAAYFPREIPASLAQVQEWVTSLRTAGIRPILATVVPVTKANDEKSRNGRMDSINAFNQATRELAAAEKIPLLDLQSALQDDSPAGYLREAYAVADGLHLNRNGYARLDQLLLDFSRTLLAESSADKRQVVVP